MKESPCWFGQVVKVDPTAETAIALSHIQLEGLLLVGIHSSQLSVQGKEFESCEQADIMSSSHNRILDRAEDPVLLFQMKFQANDHQALKEWADEIILFEGIQHPNLVQYHGVKVHRVRICY
uniref:Protein kinase domain-containing protein n=1 Tax=Magallana gigas TaxID=29159 RepID=A0A8W8JGK5_MAGGI